MSAAKGLYFNRTRWGLVQTAIRKAIEFTTLNVESRLHPQKKF
jgi:hypothetical protein